MRLVLLFLLLAIQVSFASRPCFSPDEALAHPEKDVCISAHVYDVVESSDGTRYLDVCKPEVSDGGCHFTVVSLAADRREVGDLASYKEQDIHLRGVIHVMHDESIIVLSHARQFKDGGEKFRPNPSLVAGFSAENSRTAFRDPAMSAHRHKGNTAFLSTSH